MVNKKPGKQNSFSHLPSTLCLLVLAILTVQGVNAYIKDKTPLYEKYPQLISNDTDPCVRGMN